MDKDTITYEKLSDSNKSVVNNVIIKFTDLFDNDEFGVFIEEFTPYSHDRVAQLLEPALGNLVSLINIVGIRWNIDNYPINLPIAKHALSISLTVEVIRHFIRTYVEIPDTSRVNAPDLVRRDYLQRWQGILNDYLDQLKNAAKKLEKELYARDIYFNVLIEYPRNSIGRLYGHRPEKRNSPWWW